MGPTLNQSVNRGDSLLELTRSGSCALSVGRGRVSHTGITLAEQDYCKIGGINFPNDGMLNRHNHQALHLYEWHFKMNILGLTEHRGNIKCAKTTIQPTLQGIYPKSSFMLKLPSMNAPFLVTTQHRFISTYSLMYNTFQEGATLTTATFIENWLYIENCPTGFICIVSIYLHTNPGHYEQSLAPSYRWGNRDSGRFA